MQIYLLKVKGTLIPFTYKGAVSAYSFLHVVPRLPTLGVGDGVGPVAGDGAGPVAGGPSSSAGKSDKHLLHLH